MPKICSIRDCGTPVFSKGFCAYHWRTEVLAKQQTLKQTARSPAKSFKIAPISKTRAEALKRYRRLRDKYFEEHSVCEFPGCGSTKITLHHMRGRIGAFLTDRRWFKSLCIPHHQWIEQNPVAAQKLGLSYKRLDK
ncbi:MAG TPA: hypothetical protein VN698_16405 [Bacteroidia bacterium]|nr:hypothetical protein [Bacteroidia bacterium]